MREDGLYKVVSPQNIFSSTRTIPKHLPALVLWDRLCMHVHQLFLNKLMEQIHATLQEPRQGDSWK